MSSKTVLDLASFFPPKSPNQQAVFDYGDRFSGFYIGENIVLTAAHTLHDVRWSLDAQGHPTSWTLVSASSSGVYKNNTSVVSPWNFHVSPGFYAFVNSDFAANRNPYTDASIANYDTAWATSTTSVATRELIGAGVFYGTSTANMAAIGTTVTLEYKLNGSYGTKSGALTAIGTDTVSASLNVVAGMSGGPWESSFRTVNASHTYAFGVQSTEVNGGTAALITPALFDTIMAQLAAGKSGSQAAQPTNYLHGSDGADVFQGSFRPDVIYGNGGSDTLNDGDAGKTYWANDYLFGGDGDDTFVSGRGIDLLYGGDRSLPQGGAPNIATDGFDTADYSTQFAGRNGIEIRIGTSILNTTYQSQPNFNTAIFVTDRVSSDVDTLISIETIKGSAGSDVLVIDSLTTSKTPGFGNQGGLTTVDFTAGNSSTDVDELKMGQITSQSIVYNLSPAVSYQTNSVWGLPSYSGTLIEGGLYTGQNQSPFMQILGSNMITGTNYHLPSYATNQTFDDIFISSIARETFVTTFGNDLYVIGSGDTIIIDNQNRALFSMIEFNGMPLNSGLWTPTSGMGAGIYTTVTGDPWQLEVLADQLTAVITDLRDNSSFTIKNWNGDHAFLFGYYAPSQPAQSSSSATVGDVTIVGSSNLTYAEACTSVLADAVFATGVKTAQEQLRTISSGGSNLALLGAIAAAGLSSAPVHAEVRGALDWGILDPSVHQIGLLAHAIALPSVDPIRSLSSAVAEPTPGVVDADATHVSGPDWISYDHVNAAGEEQWQQHVTELLHGTEGPRHGPIAQPLAVTAALQPVSAEMLQAMAGVAQQSVDNRAENAGAPAHAPEQLREVLLDALADGGPSHLPDINVLLHAFHDHSAKVNPLADSIAGHGAAGHETFAMLAVGYGLGIIEMPHPDAAPHG